MSWSYSAAGRASKLGEVVRQQFIDTGGCPAGSAEEAAKNALGAVVETLCKSLTSDVVVRVEAFGSAWHNSQEVLSHSVQLKFETLGGFVE